jgi:hypothetical protein
VGEFGLVGVDEQTGVVDPGRRRCGWWGFGAGFGRGMAADVIRDRAPVRDAGESDFDGGEVKRVENQLNLPPDQFRVDLIGVPC